ATPRRSRRSCRPWWPRWRRRSSSRPPSSSRSRAACRTPRRWPPSTPAPRSARPPRRTARRARPGWSGSTGGYGCWAGGPRPAAGVGVARVEESVGGRLAGRLAGGGRQVDLSSVAVSGARSDDLDLQVSRALLADRPDLAVVLVGGQDAVHGVRPRRAAAALAG